MKRQSLTKEALLPKLADHVLKHGLGEASLRPLAKAAGTSDRMLIYHFGNKQQLISQLLEHLADIYSEALETALTKQRPRTRQECFDAIMAQGRQPAMQPFLTLWWEIVAGASRGVAGYETAAQRMMARLLVWLESQMPPDDPDPVAGARYLLTLIEGSMMLEAVGHRETAQAGVLAANL